VGWEVQEDCQVLALLLSVRLAEGVGENVEALVGLSEHCWGFRVATVKLVVAVLILWVVAVNSSMFLVLLLWMTIVVV